MNDGAVSFAGGARGGWPLAVRNSSYCVFALKVLVHKHVMGLGGREGGMCSCRQVEEMRVLERECLCWQRVDSVGLIT